MSKEIKIALPEIQKKFMEWHINKYFLYGDAFEKWWSEEGLDIFFKWAKAHNIELMDIERNSTNERLKEALIAWRKYQQCDEKQSDGGQYLYKHAGELMEKVL